MTLQEFLAIVENNDISFYRKEKQRYYEKFVHQARKRGKNPPLADDYLYERWLSGGISGGSCWDTSDDRTHYSKEGNPEPEFTDLDNLLEIVCPTITFLQYKKVLPLIETGSYTEDEWYGNSSTFSQKYIKLENLYNKLKELSVI